MIELIEEIDIEIDSCKKANPENKTLCLSLDKIEQLVNKLVLAKYTEEKPKFKMTVEEMLDFNDQCEEAASHCPQDRGQWVLDDRDICLGNISAKELVNNWRKCSTLWEFGYDGCLTDDALHVFKAYDLYRAQKKVWKESNPDAS